MKWIIFIIYIQMILITVNLYNSGVFHNINFLFMLHSLFKILFIFYITGDDYEVYHSLSGILKTNR